VYNLAIELEQQTGIYMNLLQMTEKVTAFDLNSNKSVIVDAEEIIRSKRFFETYKVDEMHITGLVPPAPEKLHIINVSYYNNRSHEIKHRLCVTQEILESSFVALIKVKEGQRFEVIQDTDGHDNNISCSSSINLRKGDILLAPSDEGTSRGHYFFRGANDESIHVNECATPHAYAPAYLNPAFFKLIA
jgi:hypothetical protein